MNGLQRDMERVIDFLEQRPKLARAGIMEPVTKTLAAALTKFLAKADTLMLEETPGYAEVEALLNGESKSIVTVIFMREFARKNLRVDFQPNKADKATRSKFLKEVARGDKLSMLKDKLDPEKRHRELFDAMIQLPSSEIQERLSLMSAKDLTGIVSANGFTAPRTATGQVRKTRASLAAILSQIEEIKLANHF